MIQWVACLPAWVCSPTGRGIGLIAKFGIRKELWYNVRMPKQRTYSDEQFIDAVKNSRSWAQVFAILGLKVGGGQYVVFKNLAQKLDIDLSHMTGQGWSANEKLGRRPKIPTTEILTKDYSGGIGSFALKQRLWDEGYLDKKCQRCNSKEWFGETNHLELDHVDGDRTNNLLSNLRILCANCHSLTDTYCAKNKGKIK